MGLVERVYMTVYDMSRNDKAQNEAYRFWALKWFPEGSTLRTVTYARRRILEHDSSFNLLHSDRQSHESMSAYGSSRSQTVPRWGRYMPARGETKAGRWPSFPPSMHGGWGGDDLNREDL